MDKKKEIDLEISGIGKKTFQTKAVLGILFRKP